MYKLLLGYVLAFFYVANVISRPMALGELELLDMEDLRANGVCLMAVFKTSLTYLVQPVAASEATVE
jgi:hypothetical protein